MNPINGFTHRTAHRHGIGQQCATCGTTERKRSRPAGVALLAVAVALLGTLLFPASAFAEEGGGGGGHSFETPNVGRIIYGPVTAFDANANVVTEVGVTAYNRYDAAAYALGYSYGEVSNWSADVKAKLSNSDTGGQFYVFAQTFDHAADIDGIQWFIANVQYGSDLVWRSLYSDELIRNAISDCQRILNGENIGGVSGGIPESDGYYVMTFSPLERGSSDLIYQLGSDKYYQLYQVRNGGNVAHDYPISINKSFIDSLLEQANATGWDDAQIYLQNKPNGNLASIYYDIKLVHGSKMVKSYSTANNVSYWTGYTYDPTAEYYTSRVNSESLFYNNIVWPDNVLGLADVLKFTNLRLTESWVYHASGMSNPTTNYVASVCLFDKNGFGGNDTPVVPPTNWPDEPEAPEPPELPEPGTNPTVDPTPWSPVIDLPDLSFDLNITTDPTSDDLIDWVKKIYYELKQFHRDAQQWFTEISDSFEDVVSAINDMSSQIYAQLQRMDSNVSSEFQQTRTYLHRLFQWLANQLDFDNDPYNDSNVIYWLKQIWSKLGGGINTRPTDPTSDPENWWDWLIKAIQNFLIGLAATSSELISDFADVISQVMHQFPFSIPWDIAAFLAAFAAAPVTPEVTITIPAVEGWWASFDYHISMSAFDTAAATIRTMEKILFAAFLAWKSRDLLDFMDVTKWFNG